MAIITACVFAVVRPRVARHADLVACIPPLPRPNPFPDSPNHNLVPLLPLGMVARAQSSESGFRPLSRCVGSFGLRDGPVGEVAAWQSSRDCLRVFSFLPILQFVGFSRTDRCFKTRKWRRYI